MTSHAFERYVRAAEQDRQKGLLTLRRFFLENGLSIVVLGAFLVFWALQVWAGLRAYNAEQEDHGQPPASLAQYVASGHFIEATAENWESEFLQMAAFVWLTSFLFQKGSPESNDPYEEEDDPPVTKDSPWPARRGGWVLWFYAHSLSLAFLVLFLVAFALHATGGLREQNREAVQHGQPPESLVQYVTSSQFWFESLQNWQSEFLAIGAMVLLSVVLREKGSPESKPVQTPHSENE